MTTLTTIAKVPESATPSIQAGHEDLRENVYRQSYHELSQQHVIEHAVGLDVLEQLKSNLQQLEDLHGRLKFMMSEIGYLLRKI